MGEDERSGEANRIRRQKTYSVLKASSTTARPVYVEEIQDPSSQMGNGHLPTNE